MIYHQNNKFNKFEAVWQPYDAEICGDYLELNAEANKVMHKMYESQIPKANFDSITQIQTISNLEFKRFDVEVDVLEKGGSAEFYSNCVY